MIGDKETAMMVDYRQLIERFVREGRLLTIFVEQLRLIRQLTRDSKKKEEERAYLISTVVKMLKSVCSEIIACKKCQIAYRFRHCRNPIPTSKSAVYHVIELSCVYCGDYFTFHEKRKRVSFFNIEVWDKVNQLKRRGKGMKVLTKGNFSEPAIMIFDKKERSLPLLIINEWKVRDVQQVKYYWNKAKHLKKSLKEGRNTRLEGVVKKGKTVYSL